MTEDSPGPDPAASIEATSNHQEKPEESEPGDDSGEETEVTEEIEEEVEPVEDAPANQTPVIETPKPAAKPKRRSLYGGRFQRVGSPSAPTREEL